MLAQTRYEVKETRQQRDWEDLASFDPWSAILREPGRQEAWDLEEFLATGVRDAERALAFAATQGLPQRTRSALDFGCGVGRVTRALALQFDNVLGLDISPTMIARAQLLDRDSPARFKVGALRSLNSCHRKTLTSSFLCSCSSTSGPPTTSSRRSPP